ncbi:gamma-glutamylcyclotransferase family protein [Leptolyngbya sp. AN03gr2]|uniref:gamma-glutamylcyclotransferase family protein n=1 Tax=unclassified Leptolyngbya TaxID=2650499 RepID=UPI003D31B53E
MITVFVYGTLKPDESNYFLCVDRVTSSKPAIVHAALYDLPFGYPAIVPGDGITHGYLLTFDDPKILEILDEYEQHEPEAIAPYGSDNDYERRELEVFDFNGTRIGMAWAYVMKLEQVDRLGGIRIPGGIWHTKNHP